MKTVLRALSLSLVLALAVLGLAIVYAADGVKPKVITTCNEYKFAPLYPGDDLIAKYCEGAIGGYAYETYGCGPHDFIAEWKGTYLLVIIANHCNTLCCFDPSCCGLPACSICVKYIVCCTYW